MHCYDDFFNTLSHKKDGFLEGRACVHSVYIPSALLNANNTLDI